MRRVFENLGKAGSLTSRALLKNARLIGVSIDLEELMPDFYHAPTFPDGSDNRKIINGGLNQHRVGEKGNELLV